MNKLNLKKKFSVNNVSYKIVREKNRLCVECGENKRRGKVLPLVKRRPR